jgi:SAM-dependent methyltransferase
VPAAAQPFSRSAAVYPLLYAGKPYAREAAAVDALIRARLPAAREVLELGCGTGLHAALLARRGYRVTGLDRSAAMLARARPARGVRLLRGDLRSARLEGAFDAVVSLFHVFSYLSGPRELRAALRTAARHLRPGGVLVFDCWYAPAVLADPPRPRVKIVEDDERIVERTVFPSLRRRSRRVAVRYRYEVQDKRSGRRRSFRETHLMRAWTRAEVEGALAAEGFSRASGFEWLTGRPLSERTWGACFVARLRAGTPAARRSRGSARP